MRSKEDPMKPNNTRFAAALPAALSALPILLAACGGGGETRSPSSGDPEADRRAEMRVGGGGESGGGNDRKPNEPRTLYERLGGRRTLELLIDDVTTRVI